MLIEDSVLVVEGGEVFILEEYVEGAFELVLDEDSLEIISESEQGPAGARGADGTGSGGGEQEVPYAERTDFVGEDVIYKGYAQVGASEAAPVWRIKKLVIGIDGDVSVYWAGGSADFDKVWANHLALEYI